MFCKSGLERYGQRGDRQSVGAPLGWVRSSHPRLHDPSAVSQPASCASVTRLHQPVFIGLTLSSRRR